MIREVCLFDKFSFCKKGVNCARVHLKEVCQERECDYRKCNKRHPRPCRSYRINSFCRFGTSCKYSHRQSKEVEDQNKEIDKQNKNIESLIETTSNLTKQVADQNEEIKDLKKQLLEIETKDLQRLQKQVDGLVKTNSEKEKVIKELKGLKDNLKTQNVSAEQQMNKKRKISEEDQGQVHEEASEIEERCRAEPIKKASIEYAYKCLAQVEKLEAETKKIKRNAENLGTILNRNYTYFCEGIDDIEVKEELCEEVIERVVNLKEFLSFSEKKPDMERNLRSILNCKKYLKGYLKYPKRPSQISLVNCCKACFFLS